MSHFDIQIQNYNIEDDIKEYVTSYKQNQNSFYFDCPFCSKKDKFYVHKTHKYFTCFVCGEKGGLYQLLAFFYSISTTDAFKKVHGITKDRLNYDQSLKISLVEEKEPLDPVFDQVDITGFPTLSSLPKNHEAREYADYRGLTDEMIRMFDIRYWEYQSRLVFPILFFGNIVGYQARDIIGTQQPKTLNSVDLQKQHLLYNYDTLYYSGADYTILVEGPVDCIKCFEHNAVALLGKSLSFNQRNLLLHLSPLKRVYIGIDPEETETRMRLLLDLSPFWETFLMPIELGKDLGDYSPYEIDFLIKNSKSVFDFQDKI